MNMNTTDAKTIAAHAVEATLGSPDQYVAMMEDFDDEHANVYIVHQLVSPGDVRFAFNAPSLRELDDVYVIGDGEQDYTYLEAARDSMTTAVDPFWADEIPSNDPTGVEALVAKISAEHSADPKAVHAALGNFVKAVLRSIAE